MLKDKVYLYIYDLISFLLLLYKIILGQICIKFLFSQNIKIASYNVENFFDLNYDKTEYEEYKPNTKSLWNQRNFDIKLKNIIKVIEDLDADIIALQEIENLDLIKLYKIPKISSWTWLFIKNRDKKNSIFRCKIHKCGL